MAPLPSVPELRDLLEPVSAIAREAALEILEVYETDFTVAEKDDASPLTQADLRAHRAIVAGLRRLTPELPILSEESRAVSFAERSRWQRYWLVDPLDGTKEFVKKNGEFTVNIALIDRHRPVLGVVHVPVNGDRYFAAEGLGAFKQSGATPPTPVKARAADPGKLKVSASRSHAGDSLATFLAGLPGEVEILSRGSSLKLCMVAEGLADIYPRFGPTSEWDTAASQCVVEQAGGQVLTLDYAPLAYNTKADILNPHFLVIGDPAFPWRRYLPAGS